VRNTEFWLYRELLKKFDVLTRRLEDSERDSTERRTNSSFDPRSNPFGGIARAMSKIAEVVGRDNNRHDKLVEVLTANQNVCPLCNCLREMSATAPLPQSSSKSSQKPVCAGLNLLHIRSELNVRDCTVEGIVTKLSNLESIGDRLFQFFNLALRTLHL